MVYLVFAPSLVLLFAACSFGWDGFRYGDREAKALAYIYAGGFIVGDVILAILMWRF